MSTVLKIVGIILLVDFITGFVHWLEDSFWSPDTPLLGKWLVVPNQAHHLNGQDFLQKSWLESSWDLLLIGILVMMGAYFLHQLTWEVGFFAFLVINANQIHKWAHITQNKNKPSIVAFLQKIYILQRTRHHGQHHRKPHLTHYCTLTNVLNPVLDKLKFWRSIEYVLGKKHTYDDSLDIKP
jgi:ubiquitin-conjugating enzyme E2 variant